MMLAALAWLLRPRGVHRPWDSLTLTEARQRIRELWRQP